MTHWGGGGEGLLHHGKEKAYAIIICVMQFVSFCYFGLYFDMYCGLYPSCYANTGFVLNRPRLGQLKSHNLFVSRDTSLTTHHHKASTPTARPLGPLLSGYREIPPYHLFARDYSSPGRENCSSPASSSSLITRNYTCIRPFTTRSIISRGCGLFITLPELCPGG